MRALSSDPLLAAARVILLIFLGAIAIGGAAVTIALLALPLYQGPLLYELAASGVTPGAEFVWVLALLFLLALAVLAMAFYFFLLLHRIVNSVGEGDPFIADNARRLTRMGWTALVSQLATIPLAAAASYIAAIAADAGENTHFDSSFSIDGLLLALVLFILARVFRKGTEMRQDLEGTV
ncbi:DUF2975 domain-containing protein [Altericroceibacterium spongiae]|uniref:DUF2975 domain-containing protein n=1 Tax=Altericroceibacterium spongiae TaxID=2320269 RepID=A0A420ELX8_9SPHN|nr:DUF2975 domain-containing protein [Altericroceibacterium spongiae]RKF21616.1 DUF2975 domain-containing protein [Altericroceibacterium spongiae]